MLTDIFNLQLHVAHACNLSCDFCTHYSNHGHKGIVSLEQAREWLDGWKHRLNPHEFVLLGGEPTVHPQLAEFVSLSREAWPNTEIRLITNGFFLDRHPDLPRVLAEVKNSLLVLSIHHDSPEYLEKVEPAIRLVRQWEQEHDFRAEIRSSDQEWMRLYQGSGSDTEPFDDGDPRTSWKNCVTRHCTQLFEGKLWKCPPLAYLRLQKEKYGAGFSSGWDPYLKYEGLAPSVSDAELQAFTARKAESYCGMCPAQVHTFPVANPLPSARKRHSA